MEQLARSNLSDQIYDIISRQIIRNELKPGELIYETQISKEWGVSRSPVRDALHMLEKIRLVERTPKGGYRVTELSIDFIEHFYETVNIVYQYAFAKTAEKATPENLDEFKNALEQLETSIEEKDFDQYLNIVTEMAYRILEIAGNPLVERIARELMPTAERIQWASITYLPDRLKTVINHLRQAYDSIANNDHDGAAKAFENFAATQVEVVINSLRDEKMA
ncbi:MAG: GntR family transcriptional regulator [Thermodesulfobacteriota bacterium]